MKCDDETWLFETASVPQLLDVVNVNQHSTKQDVYKLSPKQLKRQNKVGITSIMKSNKTDVNKKHKAALIKDKVIINVSGCKFETYIETLNKYPKTLLGSVKRDFYYDYCTREYCFEKDAEIFRHILNYYRVDKLHYPRNECVDLFDAELQFFEIDASELCECCADEYADKCHDFNEIIQELEAFQTITQQHLLKAEEIKYTLRTKMYDCLENPQNTFIGKLMHYFTGIFIIVSVASTVIETVQCEKNVVCGKLYATLFFYIESICGVSFTFEYMARLYSANNRCKHIRNPLTVIDIAAIIPFYIGLIFSKTTVANLFMTLRVFRVFRVFKFSRHSKGLRVLGKTFLVCAKELSFLLFSLTVSMVIFSTMMFYIEKNVEKSEFTSIPATFWYTVVTMTTLGYGDMVPQTTLGRLIGGICSLSGVIVIALPVPVIVSNFSRIYLQSQRMEKLSRNNNLKLTSTSADQNGDKALVNVVGQEEEESVLKHQETI